MKRILPLLLVTGCASAPAAKIPFEEAFGRPATPAPAVQLDVALVSFTQKAEAARVGVSRGEKMGPKGASAWLEVLVQVQRLLGRPLQQTSPFELVRARLVLQTQLTADAQLYGDFPPAVADQAQRSLLLLSTRLALVSPAQPRVDLRRFVWPLEPVTVTSPFGYRFHPISGQYRFHSGLDLLADLSQPVYAAFDATVAFAAWNGAHGKQVELLHDPKLSTRYSHLQTLLVSQGDRVKRGEVIGLAGSTGSSTGVHVHFELIRNGVPEDPEQALAKNETSPGFPRSSFENPHFQGLTAWP